jgi:ubiquinone/menaquinone biosynthesis C-methylase UbiE
MACDPVWESIFSSRPWGKYPGEALIRFIARNFYNSPREDIRILELGCGPGANLWYLAREGFRVYGIDGSPTAINLCKSRLDAETPGWQGSIQVSDVTQIPFSDQFFHAVIDNECGSCLNWEDAKLAYNEVARVLRPKGRLFIRTFADGCVGDGTGESMGKFSWLCSEGPLKDKGLVRFTAMAHFPQLLPVSEFQLASVEQVQWSINDMQLWVKEWILDVISAK